MADKVGDNRVLLEREANWVTRMGRWNLRTDIEGFALHEDEVSIRGIKNLFKHFLDWDDAILQTWNEFDEKAQHDPSWKPKNWMSLWLYVISGREFDRKALTLLEAIWVINTSYPDPRIWPNNVAALAGTARSTATLGVSGALSVGEAVYWGHLSSMRAIEFFYKTKALLDDFEQSIQAKIQHGLSLTALIEATGLPLKSFEKHLKKTNAVELLADSVSLEGVMQVSMLDELLSNRQYSEVFKQGALQQLLRKVKLHDLLKTMIQANRGLSGYGRIFLPHDERIKPMTEYAQRLGLGDGPYLQLAFEVQEALTEARWRLNLNSSGICAALGADLGLSPREYYSYLIPCFIAGMMACFADTMEKREGSLFPWRCDMIQYEGDKPRRKW